MLNPLTALLKDCCRSMGDLDLDLDLDMGLPLAAEMEALL